MSTKGKPKGKKKGKEKKEKDPNKLALDKAFYESTIADLTQKLQQQRCTLIRLEEDHAALTEKLRVLEEDRVDIAAHLERTLIDRNNKIKDLEERLLEITKVRDEENRTSNDTIKNMEIKYKAMHDQLTSEIKLLNGKLNSLDEFRIQRDVMMAKFEDQEQSMNEKENSYREIIYNMEQKQVVEKDALKKEVEAKLLQVSEDFTRSSEIRNAGYTRRLIRENIALQKEIDTVVIAQIKAHNQLQEKEEKQKEMLEQYRALREIRDQLITNAQHKMKIIEKLTQQYELIKTKYIEAIKYRSLYEKIISRDVCDRFNMKELKRKIRILTEMIETLKRDKKQMAAHHVSHENEIIRLRKAIDSIKATLQTAITDTDKKPMKVLKGDETVKLTEDLDPEKRKNLLKELVNILAAHTTSFPETPSASTVSEGATPVYRTGRLGFLQGSETSLLETFKYQVNPDDFTGPPTYVLRHQESMITPKERQNINFIIDVEIGDPLYVSSSKDDMEEEVQVKVEQPEDDGGEEQESSDMQSSMSDNSQQKISDQTEQQEPLKSVPSKISEVKLTTAKPITNDEPASSTFEGEDDGEEEDFVQFFY